MTLTKAELTEHLFQTVGFNKRESKEFVEKFFELICDALANGKQIKLSSFGNFTLRDKRARPGRNPKTGELVEIEPRRVVTFRAGQKLKNRIEETIQPE